MRRKNVASGKEVEQVRFHSEPGRELGFGIGLEAMRSVEIKLKWAVWNAKICGRLLQRHSECSRIAGSVAFERTNWVIKIVHTVTGWEMRMRMWA